MTAGTFGKYQIVEQIGAGGFGVVYKGLDPFLNRHVAIKTCSSGDQELRRRFLREAEIAANLQHPNIVTIFDSGYQDEVPYLVQEYLDGEDLDHKIRRRDPLTLSTRLDYLLQIATGLDYAHSRDVIHRDVKPANVRVLDDGQVRIMDFGIAKLLTAQTQLTRTGMALGTAAYLPPEQIRGEAVDRRCDLFSYGVLAYELMTLERPFEGNSLSAMLYAIAHKEPRSIASWEGDCPPRLATVIETCLAKEPDARYPGFAEVIAELRNLSAVTVIIERPPVPPVPPVPLPPALPATPPALPPEVAAPRPTEPLTAVATAPPANRGRRDPERTARTAVWAMLGLLLAGMVAAAGLGAWWLDRQSGKRAEGTVTEPAPQPTAPQTAAPQTAAPQTAAPQTAAPQTAAPQTAAPQTAAPQTAAPQTAAPRKTPATAIAAAPASRPPPEAKPPAASARLPASRPATVPVPPPPSLPAPLIAGLPSGFELGQLAPGERVYMDRAFTYQSVPWQLRDLPCVRTSNDRKGSEAPLSLKVSRDVEVFVAHDLRIKNKPEWLGTFRETGLAVTVGGDDDESKTRIYQVFAREFPAGVVDMGPNAPPGSPYRASMYTVFVRPR